MQWNLVVLFFGFCKISLACSHVFSASKNCVSGRLSISFKESTETYLIWLLIVDSLILLVCLSLLHSFQKRKIYFVRGLSLLSTSFTDHVINYSFADIHGKSWTKPDSYRFTGHSLVSKAVHAIPYYTR